MLTRFFVQDTLSAVEISLERAKFDEGFYHEKHLLVLQGEMHNSHFEVSHVSHPHLDNCDFNKLGYTKNHDLYGYKSKYLQLIKTLSSEQDERLIQNELKPKVNPKKFVLAKKYLGFFDFDAGSTGIVYVFSDFNIQDPQNLQFLENVVISIDMKPPAERPDLLVLCGPFTSQVLINSKEDQDALEESYKNFSNLLLKYQKILAQVVVGMVPDLHDVVMNLLPRKPLPDYLLHELCNELPRFVLLENPLHFIHCVDSPHPEQAHRAAAERPHQDPRAQRAHQDPGPQPDRVLHPHHPRPALSRPRLQLLHPPLHQLRGQPRALHAPRSHRALRQPLRHRAHLRPQEHLRQVRHIHRRQRLAQPQLPRSLHQDRRVQSCLARQVRLTSLTN